MTKIPLHRYDVEKLVEVLKEFPNVDSFDLLHNGGSGIGYTVDIVFREKRGDRDTTVQVEVSGVENW